MAVYLSLERQINIHTGRQTHRQADRQTGRQADRQIMWLCRIMSTIVWKEREAGCSRCK